MEAGKGGCRVFEARFSKSSKSQQEKESASSMANAPDNSHGCRGVNEVLRCR